mmetsp:Transcript_70340/g.152829  ORF Transcript_70340/g.152829 Transcript_70340/m.152829 type:complete len:202 (-) Transcript_70340:182-787(-)
MHLPPPSVAADWCACEEEVAASDARTRSQSDSELRGLGVDKGERAQELLIRECAQQFGVLDWRHQVSRESSESVPLVRTDMGLFLHVVRQDTADSHHFISKFLTNVPAVHVKPGKVKWPDLNVLVGLCIDEAKGKVPFALLKDVDNPKVAIKTIPRRIEGLIATNPLHDQVDCYTIHNSNRPIPQRATDCAAEALSDKRSL